jgi:heme-degrading monooxygenase HmoA
MSVIMTLRAKGDPLELERRAAGNPDGIRAISDRAKEHGLIAHRFYGSDDGQIMVVDEWPDRESFQRFFEEARSEIEPLMRDVGVTSEPEITFWRKLDSHDEVGWDA